VVRVPAIEHVWIKKVMDAGVAGLMIPQVNSALDASAAVRRSKFPPAGVRGVGVARANRYGTTLPAYLAGANKASAVIVQVEHIDAVRNLGRILDTDGVDTVFVGPYDLSASMGRAGQITDPEVQGAIARVRKVCLARNYPMGIFANDGAAARRALEDGFPLIAVVQRSRCLQPPSARSCRNCVSAGAGGNGSTRAASAICHPPAALRYPPSAR
jgi:2-keto-3-deoxy-L-rhamnonate aldolase RhmA